MVIVEKSLRIVSHAFCFFPKLGQFGNHFETGSLIHW